MDAGKPAILNIKDVIQKIAQFPEEQLSLVEPIRLSVGEDGAEELFLLGNPYKDISCVILKMHDERVLFVEDGGEKKRICASINGAEPLNMRTKQAENCIVCQSRIKGCRGFTILDILTDITPFPVSVRVTWSSKKNLRAYMTQFTGKAILYNQIITKISTKVAKTDDDKLYTTLVFEAVGAIPSDEIDDVKIYKDELLPKFRKTKPRQSQNQGEAEDASFAYGANEQHEEEK